MKVIGLDQKEYSWNFTNARLKTKNPSKLHLRARHVLKVLFPYDIIYEEVFIPGIKTNINNRPLFADFYIHAPRLMIEVQGEQHYKFIPFFHTNKLQYFRALKLDKLKYKWCELNEIELIALPYNESDEEWYNRIRKI